MISDTKMVKLGWRTKRESVNAHPPVDTFWRNPLTGLTTNWIRPHWDGEAPVADTAGVSKRATKDRPAQSAIHGRVAR
jgi:hypothetical protein